MQKCPWSSLLGVSAIVLHDTRHSFECCGVVQRDAQDKVTKALARDLRLRMLCLVAYILALVRHGVGRQPFVSGAGGSNCQYGHRLRRPSSVYGSGLSADLDRHTGSNPLHKVVFPKPVFIEEARKEQQAQLTKTQWAQPAIE